MNPNNTHSSVLLCFYYRSSALPRLRRYSVNYVTGLNDEVEDVTLPFQTVLLCAHRFSVLSFVSRNRVTVNGQSVLLSYLRRVFAQL